MDNLPSDPPNGNNNPVDPNSPQPPQTPTQEPINSPNPSPENQIHSEVAKHEHRDSHGRFIPKHEQQPNPTPAYPPNPPTTPNVPNYPNSPNPPPPSNPYIQVTHGGSGGNKSDDDTLAEFKVNNPFSKFFNWIKKLIKSEGINIKVKPLTAIGIALTLSVGFGSGYGIGYNTALNQVAKTLFPNSSPIFHRPISLQGTIQKSESGQYYLSVPDNPLWLLKPVTNINLDNVLNKQVTVKGNLTAEPNVINVTEVISFDKPTPTPATNSGQPTP